MKFRKAVAGTAEIADDLHDGLDALSKAHKSSIIAPDAKRVTGSVDIDTALQPTYPNATRWDYAIGYRINNKDDKAFFVEYHRAKADEVPRVLRKKQWLEDWMRGKAIDRLHPRRFVWVSAGGIKIPRNAPQWRRLHAHGLRLVRRLKLG